MKNVSFPNNVIFDVRELTMEFMSIYKPGGEPLDGNDFCFIEEVLTALSTTFIDYRNFERILRNTMSFFIDCNIYYTDDDRNNPKILLAAVYNYAHSIVEKLTHHGAFINGFFPYVFRQLTNDYALIFEYAPDYVGDRYCDPNGISEPANSSMWLE